MSSKQSKRTSQLWNYFSDLGENRKKCKYCSQTLKISNRSTGNLFRHMRNKHFNIPIYRNSCSANYNSEDDVTISVGVEVDDSNYLVNNNEPSTSTQSAQQARISYLPRQKSITGFVTSERKFRECDQQLVKMIVKEYHPLRIVEDPEFRKYVQMLRPGYNLPDRKTLSCSLIPQMYSTTERKVREIISQTRAVCLTTDGWTSINNESFIAITAHFVDETTKLNSYLLGCISYTTENLCQLINEKIQEWKLENKVVAIVSDNEADIAAAIRLGGWRHVPCFAHNINLIVQSSLNDNKDVKAIIGKVKSIVGFFKSNYNSMHKLKSVQETMGLSALKLKQDFETRWNSTYDVLYRILQLKEAVISTLAIVNSDLNNVSTYEWEVIEEVCDILQIFYAVTNEISAEKVTIVSKLIILVKTIKSQIVNYFTADRTCLPKTEVRHLLLSLKDQVERRLKYVEENELYYEATLLDPRFKKFGFSDPEKYNRAYASLTGKACVVNVQLASYSTEVEDTTVGKDKETKSPLWQDFDQKVNNASKNPTEIEADNFLKEPLIGGSEDPLSWWENKKRQYPRLYELVTKRMCVIATSVPCGRIFSKTGDIITEKRTRLTSSKISQIIFLNSNLE